MRNLILFVSLLITLYSCKQKSNNVFIQLINENFFDFFDTTVYKNGQLILIPNETGKSISSDSVYILLDTLVQTSKSFYSSVIPDLRENSLSDFESLFTQDNGHGATTIYPKNINQRGRFILIGGSADSKLDTLFAGRVSFFQPLISDDHAIIFFSISVSPKAGYTTALFLRKEKIVWEKIKTIEVERW